MNTDSYNLGKKQYNEYPNVTPSTNIAPLEDQSKSTIQATKLPGVFENNLNITFWGNNPNVLIHGTELFPTSSMNFTEQINVLTRFILFLSILFAFLFQRVSFLIVGGLTIFLIWVFYVTQPNSRKEGFGDIFQEEIKLNDISGNENENEPLFHSPKTNNPFSNVLMTDYTENPIKLPAEPIDNPETYANILNKAKKNVQKAHPNFPNIVDRLFTNLGDQYDFEKSLQPFYSFPSTTIPNDQKAFTDFCYGDLISCKEGNLFACARNLPRYGEGS